jgi:hypothetical protein
LPPTNVRSSPRGVGSKRRCIQALRAKRADGFLDTVALAIASYVEDCTLKPVFESKDMYFLSYCLDYDCFGETINERASCRVPPQRMHPVLAPRYENVLGDLLKTAC